MVSDSSSLLVDPMEEGPDGHYDFLDVLKENIVDDYLF